MYPLIDGASVRQCSLGDLVIQGPGDAHTPDGIRGAVVAVYPIGHPQNPTAGQMLVDVQPTGSMPILRRVPVCLPYAHQETERALAHTARRQPYDPKPRNRMEGSSRDLRIGAFVWVQFVGANRREPVVVACMRYGGQGARAFPVERRMVDRVQADGSVQATERHPLDSDRGAYPSSVDVYNGVSREVDNAGNYHVQTSTDRVPVFPGHNAIPASPEPEGSYGISTRGARIGNQIQTTGRHPELPGESSVGRLGRQSLDADDGTIRDETRSTIGHIIHRVRKGLGRMWQSAKGGSDGRWYAESRGGSYAALGPNGAELHGDALVVLDGRVVCLGSGEAADPLTLFPQLKQVLAALWTAIDTHKHIGVTTGNSVTGIPETPTFASTWNSTADQAKAADVRAAQSNAPSPEPQDDPESA